MEKLETSHSGNLSHSLHVYFQSVFSNNIFTVIYFCNHLSL